MKLDREADEVADAEEFKEAERLVTVGRKSRTMSELLEDYNFTLSHPCVGENYRNRSLHELSSEDLEKLHRLYCVEYYPRNVVARIVQVSAGLVGRVFKAIDKDPEFVTKR